MGPRACNPAITFICWPFLPGGGGTVTLSGRGCPRGPGLGGREVLPSLRQKGADHLLGVPSQITWLSQAAIFSAVSAEHGVAAPLCEEACLPSTGGGGGGGARGLLCSGGWGKGAHCAVECTGFVTSSPSPYTRRARAKQRDLQRQAI